MSFYAQFHQESGSTFRLDTRIYLDELSHSQADGTCVAAVVGKNPGSAESNKDGWGELNLNGDNTLPSIRNRFIDAYRQAKKRPPENAFVQVWNLFYLCDKDFCIACKAIKSISEPPGCKSEHEVPKIVWFFWGGKDKRLNGFKNRFLKIKPDKAFFFDNLTQTVSENIPTLFDFARHTQGLKAPPIVQHLAKIL